MNGQDITACFTEVIYISDGSIYHQMNIQGQVGNFADRSYNRNADGDIGNEKSVHNIHMDIVGPAGDSARISRSKLTKSAERIEGDNLIIFCLRCII